MNLQPKIVSLNCKTTFSLDEANQLAAIIKKITDKCQEQLNSILQLIDNETSVTVRDQLKIDAQAVVDAWNRKITKLGAKPSGIWFADMDFGDGYYCWKYPEEKITFWHGYDEGFTKRKSIN